MDDFADDEASQYELGAQAAPTVAVEAALAALIDYLASGADDPARFRMQINDAASAKFGETLARADFSPAAKRGFAEQGALRLRLIAGLHNPKGKTDH